MRSQLTRQVPLFLPTRLPYGGRIALELLLAIGLLDCLGYGQVAAAADHPTILPGPVYQVMCDASAAVPMGKYGFIVANDEDNALRVFSRYEGGSPITEYDISEFLRIDPDHPEADIEGATWLGERVFWITSHARNKDGKLRLSRYRLFATEFVKTEGRTTLQPVGFAYKFFLDDLLADRRLAKYDLKTAMQYPPKSDFAINVEGLTQTPMGHLWVGFRNPIVEGKALIVPILNPNKVIEGRPAELGPAIELDLGGLGIRSIEYHEEWRRYIILAGPRAAGECAMYTWSGDPAHAPTLVPGFQLENATPEAFVCYVDEGKTEIQLICDDGTREIDGQECKTLDNPLQRQFRTMIFRDWHP